MSKAIRSSVRVVGGLAVALAGVAGAGAGAASAQAAEEGWSVDTRLTIAAMTGGDNPASAPDGDGLAADAGLVVSRRDYLDNGVALDWRGEVRLRRDAPGRPSFAGGFGGCVGGPACGAVSPSTGLFVGGQLYENAVEAVVEGASLAAVGPWGEGVIGLDSGVAARLDARAPQVFEAVSAFSPMLDPAGLGVVRARNDVTGPSAKVSYMTPRWLGVRAGLSYTPEANLAGADFDPKVANGGLVGADLENVVEGALSFSRRFRSNGVRIRAALTGTSAESGSAIGGFDDYEAVGAGIEFERDGWMGGVRWLSSNNARGGAGDYDAVEIGLAREAGPWRFGVEWGSASDDFLSVEGESWLVGVRRTIGDNFALGVGYQGFSDEYPVLSTASGRQETDRDGVVLELSVRN